MKSVIDACIATTGWNMTLPSLVTLNQFPEYCAGVNTASLMFKFSATDAVRTASKTFAIDTTGYEEIVFNLFSFKNRNNDYQSVADYAYKVKLASGKEFYIPTFDTFTHVKISLAGISSITEITFTPLVAGDDWLIVSEIEMIKEDLPLDVFVGIKEKIEAEITTLFGLGINLGSVTGITDDQQITLTAPSWIERYAAILIKDGTNSEIHQIQNRTDTVFTFTTLYAGNKLLHDYTAATVYLIFPVEYGRKAMTDIVIPSITIWGMAPEPVLRGSKLEKITDSWLVGSTPTGRQEGQIKLWHVLIDCEARQDELLAGMSTAVRRFIGKEVVWIDGMKHDVVETVPPTSIDPTEIGDVIPKIQYTASIEAKEELFSRSSIPLTTNIDETVSLT